MTRHYIMYYKVKVALMEQLQVIPSSMIDLDLFPTWLS